VNAKLHTDDFYLSVPITLKAYGLLSVGTLKTEMKKQRKYVMITVCNEGKSWYIDENIKLFTEPGSVNKKSGDFKESNNMHCKLKKFFNGKRVQYYNAFEINYLVTIIFLFQQSMD